jgi:hypothetical protein
MVPVQSFVCNQPSEELTDGGDLRKSASGRPSVCLAIPAFAASLDSVTDTLNCNFGCAYANEFAITVEDLVVDKLRTIAQEAVGFYEGA